SQDVKKGTYDPDLRSALTDLAVYSEAGRNGCQDLFSHMTPDQIDKLMDLTLGNPRDPNSLTGLLSQLCDTNQTDTNAVLRQILDSLKNLQAGGDHSIDDVLRSLINQLQPNAVDRLSKLPPDLLIDMGMILQNGDDQQTDMALKANVIDPAYSKA